MSRKKPELLVTARNLYELENLISAGADAIEIGSKEYGLRIPGDFSLLMIEEAIKLAHSKQVKIYITINAILHNAGLLELAEYINQLDQLQADAIIYGDPAVLVTAKEVAPNLKLHLSAETISTNYQTIDFWAKKGIKRAYLSRELSLVEVIKIKEQVDIEIQALVHGATCIFHSKRNLISNYGEFIQRDKKINDKSENAKHFLREHQRPTENYPVFEDCHGTHIMSNHDICMIGHIDKFIAGGIDSLRIEGLLQSSEYLIQITKLYKEAIERAIKHLPTEDLFNELEQIQPITRPLDTGFYFKEQIY